jgi:chromosome segregation ATPase
LVVQVRETETLTNRVTDLESQLVQRNTENGELRRAKQAAEAAAQELRDEIVALNGGKSPTLDKLRGEKAEVEQQLAAALAERTKMQRDLNVIQQQAESNWATERMENALLRERINDIAAEVAKLAMTLEGPDSPIEAILSADTAPPARAGRPANGTVPANDTPPRGSLADRIRALQAQASRANQPG